MKKILTKFDNRTSDINYSDIIGKVFSFNHNQILVEKIIAEGGFSVVYLVSNENNNIKKYALKRILINDHDDLSVCLREIEILKALNDCPYLIKMFDHKITRVSYGKTDSDDVYEILILMEYYQKNLLHLLNEHIKEGGHGLEENFIVAAFYDICMSIKYLHNFKPFPIIHRDLKLENILKDTITNQFVLCDFGSCIYDQNNPETNKILLEENIKKYTTLAYRSPEMINVYSETCVTTKSDIWALGCLLFKMCFLATPFGDNILAIQEGKFCIPKSSRYSPQLHDLIRYMLIPDPNKRPDIHEIITLVTQLKCLIQKNHYATSPERSKHKACFNFEELEQAQLSFENLAEKLHSLFVECNAVNDSKVPESNSQTNSSREDYTTSIKPRERPKTSVKTPIQNLELKKKSTKFSTNKFSNESSTRFSTSKDAFGCLNPVPMHLITERPNSIEPELNDKLLGEGFEDSFSRSKEFLSPTESIEIPKRHKISICDNSYGGSADNIMEQHGSYINLNSPLSTSRMHFSVPYSKGSISSISNVKSRESLIMSISSRSSTSDSSLNALNDGDSYSSNRHLSLQDNDKGKSSRGHIKLEFSGEDSTELLAAEDDKSSNGSMLLDSKSASICSLPILNDKSDFEHLRNDKSLLPPTYDPPPLPPIDNLPSPTTLCTRLLETIKTHDDVEFMNPFENPPFEIPSPLLLQTCYADNIKLFDANIHINGKTRDFAKPIRPLNDNKNHHQHQLKNTLGSSAKSSIATLSPTLIGRISGQIALLNAQDEKGKGDALSSQVSDKLLNEVSKVSDTTHVEPEIRNIKLTYSRSFVSRDKPRGMVDLRSKNTENIPDSAWKDAKLPLASLNEFARPSQAAKCPSKVEEYVRPYFSEKSKQHYHKFCDDIEDQQSGLVSPKTTNTRLATKTQTLPLKSTVNVSLSNKAKFPPIPNQISVSSHLQNVIATQTSITTQYLTSANEESSGSVVKKDEKLKSGFRHFNFVGNFKTNPSHSSSKVIGKNLTLHESSHFVTDSFNSISNAPANENPKKFQTLILAKSSLKDVKQTSKVLISESSDPNLPSMPLSSITPSSFSNALFDDEDTTRILQPKSTQDSYDISFSAPSTKLPTKTKDGFHKKTLSLSGQQNPVVPQHSYEPKMTEKITIATKKDSLHLSNNLQTHSKGYKIKIFSGPKSSVVTSAVTTTPDKNAKIVKSEDGKHQGNFDISSPAAAVNYGFVDR